MMEKEERMRTVTKEIIKRLRNGTKDLKQLGYYVGKLPMMREVRGVKQTDHTMANDIYWNCLMLCDAGMVKKTSRDVYEITAKGSVTELPLSSVVRMYMSAMGTRRKQVTI